MGEYFILDDQDNPVETDVETWGRWFDRGKRRVKVTNYGDYSGELQGNLEKRQCPRGAITVSTVFLGIDHRFGGELSGGKPILWETMVFGGPLDQEQERYTSKEDALKGHDALVAKIDEALKCSSGG